MDCKHIGNESVAKPTDSGTTDIGTVGSRILAFLKLKGTEVKTLAIVKEIAGPKATCKIVNPTLYKLLKEDKILKIAEENGANPRWKACV